MTIETNYYVGSLVAVDLADASIHNTERFFTFLNQTHNPVISIWKTKQRVFENYNEPSLAAINQTILTVINKSLMFSAAFYLNPAKKPDIECVKNRKRIEFLTPDILSQIK
jgi:hypothetical protein